MSSEFAQEIVQSDMQRVTAIAVRENLAPGQFTLSDVQRASICTGYCTASWHAAAPAGEYDCTAVWGPGLSPGMHETVCVKK